MKDPYVLRVYGLPRVADEGHGAERAAIESARHHLRGRERPVFAEVREKLTSRSVWTGYLTESGSIAEHYEREPGA